MGDGEIISGKLPTGGRLDKALAEATDLSRARIQALIAQGSVTVGGAVATQPSAKVEVGA